MQKKLEIIIKNSNLIPNNKMVNNFNQFFNLLIEGNKICNLTAITEEDEVIEKHFFDSIFPHFAFKENSKVIDVGAGAGFPSLPLKIVRPDLNFTLLDSLNKRVNFLNNVIADLKLTNIEAIHGRAEDLAKNSDFREKFDIATARAVANLKVLAEYCLPFVKVGGAFIALKSGTCEEEISDAKDMIKVLGGKIKEVVEYKINDNDRKLIIIEKLFSTPSKYPRKPNQIKK